jgi:hypothetical protein
LELLEPVLIVWPLLLTPALPLLWLFLRDERAKALALGGSLVDAEVGGAEARADCARHTRTRSMNRGQDITAHGTRAHDE